MAIIQVTVSRRPSPPPPPQNNGRNGICTPPKHFSIPCSCCCGCDGNVSRTGVRYIIRWPAAVHGTRSQLCSTTPPPPLGSSHFAIYMTLCSCTTLPQSVFQKGSALERDRSSSASSRNSCTCYFTFLHNHAHSIGSHPPSLSLWHTSGRPTSPCTRRGCHYPVRRCRPTNVMTTGGGVRRLPVATRSQRTGSEHQWGCPRERRHLRLAQRSSGIH